MQQGQCDDNRAKEDIQARLKFKQKELVTNNGKSS
jgi:hypothetical protein